MQALNDNLKRDRKFKKFIRKKQREKDELEQLEKSTPIPYDFTNPLPIK